MGEKEILPISLQDRILNGHSLTAVNILSETEFSIGEKEIISVSLEDPKVVHPFYPPMKPNTLSFSHKGPLCFLVLSQTNPLFIIS
jgi:hypothetical protein